MRPNKADYIHSTAHCKLEIMEKQPDLYVGEKTDDFLQTVQEFALNFHLFEHVVRPAKMKQFWLTLKAQRFMNLYQECRL